MHKFWLWPGAFPVQSLPRMFSNPQTHYPYREKLHDCAHQHYTM